MATHMESWCQVSGELYFLDLLETKEKIGGQAKPKPRMNFSTKLSSE